RFISPQKYPVSQWYGLTLFGVSKDAGWPVRLQHMIQIRRWRVCTQPLQPARDDKQPKLRSANGGDY
ncbi:MAG: hypothetical protein OEV22_06635, partial [Deltaproteobacteria bacterium]|nr:hypothetical protein [Deltaproteobacteria bacterium]